MKIEAGRKFKVIVSVSLYRNDVVLRQEYNLKTTGEFPSKKALTEAFFADWFKENQHKHTKFRTNKFIQKSDVRVSIV